MKNIFLLVLMLFTLTVQAQEQEDSSKKSFDSSSKFVLFLGIQFNHQSFTNLNARLNSLGALYSELPKGIISSNFGWTTEKNNLLFKSTLSIGRGMKGNPEKRSTILNLVSGSFEWGYNLSKSKNTRFYPTAGLGVYTFTATLNKDLSNINFNDVLQNPNVQIATNPIKISNTFLNYRVGFEMDFFNKKYSNYGTGFFAGYSGSFNKRAWKLNMEQQVANAPSDGLSQFYAGINLLMQRKKSKKQ